MAQIGERASLTILHEKSYGLYLDGGELGEVLLPHREVPKDNVIWEKLDVFLYTDSEDRPVATLLKPHAMPGEFAKLKCVDITGVGAFMDWGLAKDLLVPFGEQKQRMVVGKSYLVHVLFDNISERIVGSTRIARGLDKVPAKYQAGEEVDLIIFEKSDLGYKAIINNTHSGLVFHDQVFQELQIGEKMKGYIVGVREDGKVDLTLHPPRKERVGSLEETILTELNARGGFWPIGDHSTAEEIHDELGVSKRTFKQAVGALLKKRQITIEKGKGIRVISS